MTEREWRTGTDPARLFEYLASSKRHGRLATTRKLRLLRVACCRRVWPLIGAQPCREAVELAERFADGGASDRRRGRALVAARQEAQRLAAGRRFAASCAAWSASYCLEKSRLAGGLTSSANALGWAAVGDREDLTPAEWPRHVVEAEEAAQADLLRDILGNPFRPAAFHPAWRTDTAVALARTMYDSRDFGAMPILADALQDAACDCEDTLAHCRDTNQAHVRGCWSWISCSAGCKSPENEASRRVTPARARSRGCLLPGLW